MRQRSAEVAQQAQEDDNVSRPGPSHRSIRRRTNAAQPARESWDLQQDGQENSLPIFGDRMERQRYEGTGEDDQMVNLETPFAQLPVVGFPDWQDPSIEMFEAGPAPHLSEDDCNGTLKPSQIHCSSNSNQEQLRSNNIWPNRMNGRNGTMPDFDALSVPNDRDTDQLGSEAELYLPTPTSLGSESRSEDCPPHLRARQRDQVPRQRTPHGQEFCGLETARGVRVRSHRSGACFGPHNAGIQKSRRNAQIQRNPFQRHLEQLLDELTQVYDVGVGMSFLSDDNALHRSIDWMRNRVRENCLNGGDLAESSVGSSSCDHHGSR